MSSGSALRIVKHSHDVTEYRVLATSMWGFWMWLIILSVVVIISPERFVVLYTLGLLALWLLLKCRSVLYESILSLPPHGVQIETHLGFPNTPFTPPIILFINRRFIPLPSIKDIIIHEGLYGWNVRYYLAIMCIIGSGTREERVVIRVVFENILPKFPILKEVYLKLREDLLKGSDSS